MMEPAAAAASCLPKGDPDPNGDVILAVGPEDAVKQIRVATKVLSLASPVFAVMFGPQWAEGQGLSTIDPPSVRLKEDDPDAMQCMLSVLHYRKIVSTKVPLLLFKKVALLCDKYDCSVAMSSWAQDRLRKMVGGADYDILWLAYVFGCAHTFWKVTRDIMHDEVGTKISIHMQSADDIQGWGLLPHSMLGEQHSRIAPYVDSCTCRIA